MPTYGTVIEGVQKEIQPNWSLSKTANGRDRFTFSVVSLDGSYIPEMDDVLYHNENIAIVISTVANPTVISTSENHYFITGDHVEIAGHTGSTPSINGFHDVTVTSGTTFTIPLNVTVAGLGGVVARRLFGGYAITPRTAGLGGMGVVPITTTVNAADKNVVTERRFVKEVLLSGTVKSMLTTLVANYMPGFTLHAAQANGPTLGDLDCDYLRLDETLNQIAALWDDAVWVVDEYDRLRMFDPSLEIAPYNVVDGNGIADGDITVEPTRVGYANRVILRFSNAAVAAYAFLETIGNFANLDVVVIGSKHYVFQTVLTNVDGNVLIGAHAQESLENLIAAINMEAGAGTTYAAAMTSDHTISATLRFADQMLAYCRTAGASGNSTVCTTTAANASWITEGGGATGTFQFGADQALTNVVVAEDTVEQGLHGIWEVVIQADTTDFTLATNTAAAYLAIHLVTSKKVVFNTYKMGLRPGMTLTITIASRGINNLYLITDVNFSTIGNLVKRTVTAIESLMLNSSPRWRDKYKQWNASSSTTGVAISGTTTTSTSGAVLYPFGGSDIEWQRSATPTWVSANSIQIRIDTVARGSTTGICYVRMRAKSGTVTARLRDVTNNATVGTSSATVGTGFQTFAFAVALTAGAYYYEVQLLPSLANVDVQLGSAYME